ncbi:Rubredoxin [Fontimonas thermophila]|uniref:Rubredoxin n=1 Tax=Fontimonas thermophila TaxID=1076937 RepID=A0A1I2KJB4_9GAMM|nr:Rubredoxin [Fontimonas thermophila]
MARYQCPDCGYIYDERAGDIHGGLKAGTAWSEVPEDWACPDCAVRDKPDFVRLEDPSSSDKDAVSSSLQH